MSVTLADDASTTPLALQWLLEQRDAEPCDTTKEACTFERPTQQVSLLLRQGARSRLVPLGAPRGLALPLDLSACNDQPRGQSACALQADAARRPPYATDGILAHLGIVDTFGYTMRSGYTWVVVHDHGTLLLIESRQPLYERRTVFCDAKASRIVLIVPHAPGAPLSEVIFISTTTSPTPQEIVCERAWAAKARCTG